MTNIAYARPDATVRSGPHIALMHGISPLDILGAIQSPVFGNFYGWQNRKYPVIYPTYLPGALRALDPYRGKTIEQKLGEFSRSVKDIGEIWYKYIMGISANLREYETNEMRFNEFWNWALNYARNAHQAENYENDIYWSGWNQVPHAGLMFPGWLRNIAEHKVQVAKAQQALLAAEDAYKRAISYYTYALDALNTIKMTVDAPTAWMRWEAFLKNYADETARWTAWKTSLAGSTFAAEVGKLRELYIAQRMQTQNTIEQKTAAQAEKTGKEFGEVAVTTKMKTGLWSREQLSFQQMTLSQIKEAVNTLDSYIIELKPALTRPLSQASQIYNQVTPKAKAFHTGVSLAVRTSAMYRAKQSEYDNLVKRVQQRFTPGEGKVPWGAILGLGAAAAGVIAVAT